MAADIHQDQSRRQTPFKTSYLSNPWNLPNLDDKNSTGMVEPLFTAEVTYKVIDLVTPTMGALEPNLPPIDPSEYSF